MPSYKKETTIGKSVKSDVINKFVDINKNSTKSQKTNKKKYGYIKRVKRSFRYAYLKILRIKQPVPVLARGMAVGVFVGFMPVIPFQTVIAVALAFIVRGSKIAAALGTWVSNPVNMIPFYFMLYYVGCLVVPFQVHEFNPDNLDIRIMLQQGWEWFSVMLIGGLVLGIPASLITYIITFKAVKAYRERKIKII